MGNIIQKPELFQTKSESENLEPLSKAFWGNAKPPSTSELTWIQSFGKYESFDSSMGSLSSRLIIKEANLKEATRIIVFHHYLHRGRTMAQLPYWIILDEIPVGVILFSLPRLSVSLFGVPPMNLLELARLWISPTVQKKFVSDSNGRKHALSIASCAMGKALRSAQKAWYAKYPNLPDILAIVSWADTVHHEGKIYRAANFKEMGTSGGSLHGNRRRNNGGKDQLNPDYKHVKTVFLYKFKSALSDREKKKIEESRSPISKQLSIFSLTS